LDPSLPLRGRPERLTRLPILNQDLEADAPDRLPSFRRSHAFSEWILFSVIETFLDVRILLGHSVGEIKKTGSAGRLTSPPTLLIGEG